ncbi:MAG: hypothetical protein H6667_01770 [Ardenticatenaceae bacterium]|nr:hypothetical protein [Ardenticatenaceae bacterium]MCB9445289.1 hypothetical protein [Ardenticatenaceae bacterium]
MTNEPFTYKEAVGYFRMGLVTGLVSKQELIDWADREILRHEIVEPDIVELSFCGKRPYSEIIWLLGQFEHGSHYQTSVNLILARADLLQQQAIFPASDIITGLRLLIEEMWLDKATKSQLQMLKDNLEQYKRQAINNDSLSEQLTQFLAPYRAFQPHLASLLLV